MNIIGTVTIHGLTDKAKPCRYWLRGFAWL